LQGQAAWQTNSLPYTATHLAPALSITEDKADAESHH
jgi:hypothetical protein